MDKAIELAEECLKNAPLALKWTKYIVHAADQMSEEDAMRYSDAAYRFLEKTADGIEARPPSSRSARRTGRASSSFLVFALETPGLASGGFAFSSAAEGAAIGADGSHPSRIGAGRVARDAHPPRAKKARRWDGANVSFLQLPRQTFLPGELAWREGARQGHVVADGAQGDVHSVRRPPKNR